jgi:hypothetical protein
MIALTMGISVLPPTPRPGGPVLVNAHSIRPSDVRAFEEIAQAPARSR